jgi:hypothetical protein
MRGLIRFVGGVVTLATSLALLGGGALFLVMPKHEIYQEIDRRWEDLLTQLPEGWPHRQILAVLVLILGLLMFFSFFIRGKKRRRRSISFAGAHGDVTIELENIEGVIEKVARKLPEVRDIAIRLEPTDARSRVLVLAEAALMKDADADARQVTDRVQEYVKQHTRKILGVQEVDVRLTVKKFLLNMRSVKPMPLLLEGPRETALVVTTRPADGEAVQPS